ncbi:MAG TPA: PA0069 family radical SAM protein, partial [Longimicrobiales bacterium]|nr:PA0069 family radical SAM protein [Longimicrobiales bacterium]
GYDGSMERTLPIRGRGASHNPPNRFEPLHVEPDPSDPDDGPLPRTRFFRDHSRDVVSTNQSPDVPLDLGINPYRGCEHGCVYCFARPYHEFLGFSAGLDFETKIVVKEDAPARLREKLSSAAWMPRPLMLSGATDPYQPVERRLEVTRGVLQVLAEARNPVAVITKNHLVSRDVDLLAELAEHGAVSVTLSVTTLRNELQRVMEPRTSIPARRLKAMETLARAGVPVGVMVAPVIPGLTDHELPAILEASAAAGARAAGFILLRLPLGVAPLFARWLGQHFPDRQDKVLNRLRALRGGALYDGTFGHRKRGRGPYAQQVRSMFDLSLRRSGLQRRGPELSTAAFRRPRSGEQMELGI